MPPPVITPLAEMLFSPLQLYPKQRSCFLGGGANVRFRYTEASSGSGKTWAASLIAGAMALNLLQDDQICWLGPIYTQSQIGFRMLRSMIPDEIRQYMEKTNSISASAGNMRISFDKVCRALGYPGMGGTVVYRTAEKSDSIFGEYYKGAFVDEASRVSGISIMALMSTLGKSGYAYPIWLWGNVKGRNNYFYKECRRVVREMRTVSEQDQRSYYNSMTYHNAIKSWQRNKDGSYVLDFSGSRESHGRMPVQSIEHINDMRLMYTEEQFEELYENRPMSDSSRPFPDDDIDACSRTCWCGLWDDEYILCPTCQGLSDKPPVAAGWDVARQVDYNCIILFDEDSNVCGFYHWRENNWHKILHKAMEYIPFGVPFMVDVSGKGDCIPDLIQEHYPERIPFAHKAVYNVLSGPKLDKHLMSAFQSRDICVPLGLITEELASIETVPTATGVKYEAPDEYFDDCVDALAMAKWMLDHGQHAETYLMMSAKDKTQSRTGWEQNESGLFVGAGSGPGTRQHIERPTRTGWSR